MNKKVIGFLALILAAAVGAVLWIVTDAVDRLLSDNAARQRAAAVQAVAEKIPLFDKVLTDTADTLSDRLALSLQRVAVELHSQDVEGVSPDRLSVMAEKFDVDGLGLFAPTGEPIAVNDLDLLAGIDIPTVLADQDQTSGRVSRLGLMMNPKKGRLMTAAAYRLPRTLSRAGFGDVLLVATAGVRDHAERRLDAWRSELLYNGVFLSDGQGLGGVWSVNLYLLETEGAWSLLTPGRSLARELVEPLNQGVGRIDQGVDEREVGAIYARTYQVIDLSAIETGLFNGDRKAVVEVIFDEALAEEAAGAILEATGFALAIAAPILFLISWAIFNHVFVAPVRRLEVEARQIAEGAGGASGGLMGLGAGVRGVEIPISDTERGDEIGEMARSFKAMQASLKGQINALQLMNEEIERGAKSLAKVTQSAERFVPRVFLRLLNRESLASVDLGDNAARTMTVLFADIRDFTSLSEGMTPDQLFVFINNYLGRMGPIIRTYDGFIDKYIGDAIMALFDDPEDAVNAALTMLERLERYNETRLEAGRDPIRIGIGVNTGPLMLGTIGEAHRIDGTVISDTVNLASRVEGLTKQYGKELIITQNVAKALPDQASYKMVGLGGVTVRGKTKPVDIFSVEGFVTRPAEDERRAVLPTYLDGVEDMACNRFAKAKEKFEACLDAWGQDEAIIKLIDRCSAELSPMQSTPKPE